MSPYLIVFLSLIGFAVCEYRQKKTNQLFYWLSFSVLTLMLVLRYGQGTDYIGYFVNYQLTPTIWSMEKLLQTSVHGEPGWLFLCAVLRGFKIPFQTLIVLFSLLTMWGLHRFLRKHSPMMTVSLLLAYPTIYLTYAMSAVRQALVLAVFLGFLLEWLQEKKYVRYIVITLICALFHSSALVFLALFAVKKLTLRTRMTVILMAACTVLGFGSSRFLLTVSDSFAYYAEEGISLFAVVERLISTALILYVFRDTLESQHTAQSSSVMYLLQVYLYGSILYCGLMWNALLSARFAVYFKAVELALFSCAFLADRPLSLGRLRIEKLRVGKLIALYLLVFTVAMYFKNINSYLGQNNYHDFVNVFNYPYLSVFDKDRIHQFLTVQEKYLRFLGK